MKAAKATLFSLVVLLSVAVTADAFARGRGGGGRGGGHGGHGFHGHHGGHGHHGHRGGARFGLFVGFPAFGYYSAPYFYPPYSPYYYPQTYYPQTYYSSSPPVYVEQGQAPAPAQAQPAYWYYCRESNAYYPHVEQCAGQWERVPPRPPS